MDRVQVSGEARWNHNIHYHDLLLQEVPPGARRALDIGCGEGLLTRRLAERVAEVVGVDLDEASVRLARRAAEGRRISYVVGDFLEHPFESASFDVVVSAATLHHVDAAPGLSRMRELLKPGGTLGIIGLARSTAADLPYDLAGAVATRLLRRSRGWYEPASPTKWPPPETFATMRRIVAAELPGARFRRHFLWRYTVIWRKPGAQP